MKKTIRLLALNLALILLLSLPLAAFAANDLQLGWNTPYVNRGGTVSLAFTPSENALYSFGLSTYSDLLLYKDDTLIDSVYDCPSGTYSTAMTAQLTANTEYRLVYTCPYSYDAEIYIKTLDQSSNIVPGTGVAGILYLGYNSPNVNRGGTVSLAFTPSENALYSFGLSTYSDLLLYEDDTLIDSVYDCPSGTYSAAMTAQLTANTEYRLVYTCPYSYDAQIYIKTLDQSSNIVPGTGVAGKLYLGWNYPNVNRGDTVSFEFTPNNSTWYSFSLSTGSNLWLYDENGALLTSEYNSTFDFQIDDIYTTLDAQKNYTIIYSTNSYYYEPSIYITEYKNLTGAAPADGYYCFTPKMTQYYEITDRSYFRLYDTVSESMCSAETDGTYQLLKDRTYLSYLHAGESFQPSFENVNISFTDIKSGAYYETAVSWAVANNITTGTSANTFSPDNKCTRGQIVTFLWRAAGSPKASTTSTAFTDIKEGSYYYDAVLWAVENGITSGTTATTFSPNSTCTRGQIVTFLWRFWGEKKASVSNPFADTTSGAYYAEAMLWAVENGITTGTSATSFSPANACTRGQCVTFLYRSFC